MYADPVTGKPNVEYTVSAFDAGHVLEGIIALAKIAYVSGATEIDAFLPGVEPFVVKRSSSASSSPNGGLTTNGDLTTDGDLTTNGGPTTGELSEEDYD